MVSTDRRPAAASGSYDVGTRHRDLKSEVHRLRTQALLSFDKEFRTLTWFGLRDGMHVLELGSGPGFVSEQLLRRLPQTTITAIEVDARLARLAHAHLERVLPGGQWRVVHRSAADTGLAPNSCDLVLARLLFQHLPDPIVVAREALRVLRPGGKLVIIDVDDGMWGIADPAPVEEAPILAKLADAQASEGGNRFVGRRLWRILLAAGFTGLDLEVIAAHSDALGMLPFVPQLDPDRLVPQVEAGVLTRDELETVRASRARFLGSSGSFLLQLYLMVCGQKPAESDSSMSG